MIKLLVDNRVKLILLLILTLAFFLRVYNINWDQNYHLHPDERAIVMFALPLSFPDSLEEFLSPESPLNPNFFAYGNFPLYLLKSTASIAEYLNPDLANYNQINLVGRFISAFVDTLTVFLVYRLGSLIFNKRVGLFGSFLYTLSVFPIQASHFYTADILLTFFILLTLLRLTNFYKNPSVVNATIVGVSFGLATATKISALPLTSTILVTILLLTISSLKIKYKNTLNKKTLQTFLNFVLYLALIVVSSILSFALVQPYALIDLGNFIVQNIVQSQMTHDAYIFPYTLQYVNKIPIFYEITNIFLWGQGIIISTICFLGLFIIGINFGSYNKDKKFEIIIVYSFMLIFFVVVANFAVGWMRYLLPIYPLLCISGGVFLYYMFYNVLKKIAFDKKVIVFVSIFILIIFWPASFMSIYFSTHPRIEATEWINENVPEFSTIAVEHWDDRLPLNTENKYNFEELPLYEQPDDEKKWSNINSQLKNSQYIIIASNRLYVPLQELSDCKKYKKCYPKTSEYYKKLFNDRLEFEIVAEFTSYPTIPFLGIRIDDQSADESFTVYDHPKVIIFKSSRL